MRLSVAICHVVSVINHNLNFCCLYWCSDHHPLNDWSGLLSGFLPPLVYQTRPTRVELLPALSSIHSPYNSQKHFFCCLNQQSKCHGHPYNASSCPYCVTQVPRPGTTRPFLPLHFHLSLHSSCSTQIEILPLSWKCQHFSNFFHMLSPLPEMLFCPHHLTADKHSSHSLRLSWSIQECHI